MTVATLLTDTSICHTVLWYTPSAVHPVSRICWDLQKQHSYLTAPCIETALYNTPSAWYKIKGIAGAAEFCTPLVNNIPKMSLNRLTIATLWLVVATLMADSSDTFEWQFYRIKLYCTTKALTMPLLFSYLNVLQFGAVLPALVWQFQILSWAVVTDSCNAGDWHFHEGTGGYCNQLYTEKL